MIGLIKGCEGRSDSTTQHPNIQPRSSIFRMFDDVILMSDGEVIYSGPADAMTSYFSSLGHPCPKVKGFVYLFVGLGGDNSVDVIPCVAYKLTNTSHNSPFKHETTELQSRGVRVGPGERGLFQPGERRGVPRARAEAPGGAPVRGLCGCVLCFVC